MDCADKKKDQSPGFIAHFSERLLAWFDKQGRHTLPWQKHRTPYRVWIAEIMLQQTQVNTVIPYFERFMQAFPQLKSLAQATEDDVLHLWTGLGYYARARNLHKTAKILCAHHQGQFPRDIDSLTALPGIGRSTAGAILSMGWQQRATILDGNVKRVLCRLHAIEGRPGEKQWQTQLWTLAEHYTPTERVADYTQAIMDFGATRCKRHQPDCDRCPFAKRCLAHQQQREQALPQARVRKRLPTKQAQFIILVNQAQHVLLEKRPSRGIWGGLWSLPEYHGRINALVPWCEHHFCCQVHSQAQLTPRQHTFSHFRLHINPLLLHVATQPHLMMADQRQVWYNINKPDTRGLAAPIKKLLQELLNDSTDDLLPKIAATS